MNQQIVGIKREISLGFVSFVDAFRRHLRAKRIQPHAFSGSRAKTKLFANMFVYHYVLTGIVQHT